MKHFLEETAGICKGLRQKEKDLILQKKVTKVLHDNLIVHKKERRNHISEAQGDLQIALKLKVRGCGYLSTNVNKRLKFKI